MKRQKDNFDFYQRTSTEIFDTFFVEKKSIDKKSSYIVNGHFRLILCQVVKMNNAQFPRNLFKQKKKFDFNHRT